MSMLERALDYARRGWFVFPIEARGKKPLTLNGMTAATTSPETIKKWWDRWPEANIGLNCVKSGLVVVDIDPRNSGDATWTEYVLKNELIGAPPKTLTARSGGGGTHYVYRAPADAKFKQELKKDGGVDLKHRGYILLEPSIHPSGGKYEWTSDLEDNGPPELLPDWMYADMKREAASASDFSGEPVDNETWELLQEAIKHTTIKNKRGEWVSQGMALHSAGRGAEALALWHERSELTDSYDYDELEDEWLTFKTKKDSGIRSYKSIFHEAKVGGWVHPGGNTGRSETAELAFSGEYAYQETEPAPTGKKRKYVPRITPYDEMDEGGATHELIEDLLPGKGLGLVYGQSGVGKTFLAQYLCMNVAGGREFFNHRTRGSVVAYVAAESPESVHRRFAAARKQVGVAASDLYTVHEHVVFTEVESVDAVIEAMQGFKPPALVVVDTLASAWAGTDENSPEGMGGVIKVMTRIRDAIGAAVVVVHHSGKNAALGARGHTSLRAAVDLEVEVKQVTDQICAKVTKNRNGQMGQTFFGTLQNLPLGDNFWGRPTHTAILVPDLDQAAAEKAFQTTDQGPKGPQQRLLLDGLRERWHENDGAALDVSIAEEIGVAQFPQGATKSNSLEANTQRAVRRALEGLTAGGWILREGDRLLPGVGE